MFGMNKQEAKDDVGVAATAWVRADWEFRLGPRAFTRAAQDGLVRAEADLRKAITGRDSLAAARVQLWRQERGRIQ